MTRALTTIAALLIGYATVSRRLKRLNVSGAMFFTTAGLLVGPGLGLDGDGVTVTVRIRVRPGTRVAGLSRNLGGDVLPSRSAKAVAHRRRLGVDIGTKAAYGRAHPPIPELRDGGR